MSTGSVSAACLSQTHIPVMLLPPQSEGRGSGEGTEPGMGKGAAVTEPCTALPGVQGSPTALGAGTHCWDG